MLLSVLIACLIMRAVAASLCPTARPRLHAALPCARRLPLIHRRTLVPELSEREKAARKRVRWYLSQMPGARGGRAELGPNSCTDCLNLIDAMRAEGLRPSVDAHNRAMGLCAAQLHVVERLFGELQAEGNTNEGSYTALVQAQVARGELVAAVATIDALLSRPGLQPRLRTGAPLLTRLMNLDGERTAQVLWERLARSGVEFSSVEYDARLRMHGRAGDVRQLRLSLSELLRRQPVPNAASVGAIVGAVQDCATAAAAAPGARATVRHTRIDANGHCECSGTQLQLLGLSGAERLHMRSTLLERAKQRSQQGLQHLEQFCEWLRVQPPFDYVLDGPNIAYFGQNFEGGGFSYRQIQEVLDTLRLSAPGARVLLLLPRKYLKREIPNHTCSSAQKTRVSDDDRALISAWREDGTLYECSPALYDDWYWMYATVAETREPGPEDGGDEAARPKNSRPRGTCTARTGDQLGDWPPPPAVRTRVVTNDAMRDHHSDLLPPLAFARWKHSQVAGFTCSTIDVGASEDDRSGGDSSGCDGEGASLTGDAPATAAATAVAYATRVALAPGYSIEAQVTGDLWHVPVPDTTPKEWLCIHLPAAD